MGERAPQVDGAPLRRSQWLQVPPPLLFVTSFMAGLTLGKWVAPHPLLPDALHGTARAVGWGLVALALVFIAPAVLLFLRHRTTLMPHSRDARVLVASGPFRFTRNPMYLGFTAAYVGAALIINAVWPLLLLALPLWVLNEKVIPYEEDNLVRNFGGSYRAYQERVRRWL